jgi:hypothetical protein
VTTNKKLAVRDDKRFRPIFELNILSDSDYELIYTDNLEVALAVKMGMVVIDECDKLLREKRLQVKNWLDKERDNRKLKIIFLSGCPYAEDNEMELNYIHLVLKVATFDYAPYERIVTTDVVPLEIMNST